MTIPVHAVYEEGVLKPSTPVDLPDGARVDILILTALESGSRHSVADLLEEIADLPAGQQPNDHVSHPARDHDRILYLR
jgi:predicted DNA-binding antitoxin AbrB/MazE fold protein